MRTCLRWSVGLVSILCAWGCLSTRPPSSALMQSPDMENVSAAELRLNVRSLARPFGGIIEATTDRAAAMTSDPKVRLKLIRWKSEAIPAMHGALFIDEPLAALIDAAALVEQMQLYTEAGAEIEALDTAQIAVIREGITAMRARLKEVLIDTGVPKPAVDEFWPKIEGWAREHPIRYTFAIRHSTTPLFARFEAKTSAGIGGAVGDLQAQLLDIAARMDLYAEFLPRQARWQTQHTAEQLLDARLARRALSQVGGSVPVAIADLPIDLEGERDLLLARLHADVAALGEWYWAERETSFGFVSSERQAVLDAVALERQVVLAAVAAEREAVIRAISNERRITLEDVDEILRSTARETAISAIDHAFLRLAQLLAVVLPGILLAPLGLVGLLRRPLPKTAAG